MTIEGPIILTGASGFIGGALASTLLAENADVHCLLRPKGLAAARERGIPTDRMIEITEFRHADLRPIMEALQPAYVFHLAASGVTSGILPEEEVLRANVDLVTQLLLAVRACQVKRFIHTGSCFEYATSSTGKPLTEESLVVPESVYGAAKAASVLCGNALARHLGIPLTTLRLFGVFGPGEDPERLLPYLVERLASDRRVDLTEGEQIRDFLFIGDVVEAYMRAALSPDLATYHVYNVCSGRGTRIRDLALAVARVLGKSPELLAFGERAYRDDECMQILGDNSRFLRDTDWQPRTSLEDGISRTIKAKMAAADWRLK